MTNYAAELESKLKLVRDSYNVKRNSEKELTSLKDFYETQINNLNLDNLNKALLLLQKLSQKQRQVACARLEELGTKALQYSLGEQYSMKIEISSESKKRPQAYLYVVNNTTGTKTNPIEDNGGGVVDIISVALRLVVLQAQQPQIDGPILLDEPFKMVSVEYIPMLAEFIKKISTDFGRQIIMITHNSYLAESCESVIVI